MLSLLLFSCLAPWLVLCIDHVCYYYYYYYCNYYNYRYTNVHQCSGAEEEEEGVTPTMGSIVLFDNQTEQ